MGPSDRNEQNFDFFPDSRENDDSDLHSIDFDDDEPESAMPIDENNDEYATDSNRPIFGISETEDPLQGFGSGFPGSSTSGYDDIFSDPNPLGSSLRAGLELNRGFVLEQLLGTGTLGETWMTRDQIDERNVVIKLVPSVIQENESAFSAFRDAYRKAEMLIHPSICSTHPLTEDKDRGFFAVSTYHTSMPLEEYYEHYIRQMREFPLSQAVRLFWPVARALDHAHSQKAFHRDIKSNNILIGKGCGVILTDFYYIAAARELLGSLAGEPVPMPPSDLAKADQSELARVICRLFYGESLLAEPDSIEAFESEEMTAHVPEGSINVQSHAKYVKKAIRRAIAADPNERFRTCKDFIRAMVNIPLEDEVSSVGVGAAGFFGASEGLVDPGLLADTPPSPDADVNLWPFEDDARIETPQKPEPGRFDFSFATEAPGGPDVPSGVTSFSTAIPVRAKKPGSSKMLINAILGGLAAVLLAGGGYAAYTILIASKNNQTAQTPTGATPNTPQVQNANPVPLDPDVPETEGLTEITPIASEVDKGFDFTTTEAPTDPGAEGLIDPPAPPVAPPDPIAPSEPPTALVDPETFKPAPAIMTPEIAPSVKTLEELAQDGNPEAQRVLGEHYFTGTGGCDIDPAKAAFWLEKAAEQGDSSAKFTFGKCYERGIGVEKDMEKAFQLYEESAVAGDIRGEMKTGWCYGNGEGVAKDVDKAAAWYMKAAEKGEKQAQVRVGACYESGIGFEKNIETAITWYEKAAAQGEEKAKTALTRLGQ